MEKQGNEASKKVRWSALLRTIKQLRLPWLWVVIGLSLNLILSELQLKLPDTTADLLSGNLTGSAVTKAILFYVTLGLMSFFMVAGQVQAQSYSVKRARDSIWKKMLGMRMDFFDKNDPSDLMSTVTNDAGEALLALINVIIYFIPCVWYVVRALMRISEYHWILAASCFMLLPLKYVYALVMGKTLEKNTARIYGTIGILTGFLADRICNLMLIKSYTNEQMESEAGEHAANDLLKANMKLVHIDNACTAILSVMDVLQQFVVVVVAVILLQRGKIDIAMWLAFFLFSQNLFLYMDQIVDSWVRLKSTKGIFHRIIAIMEGDSEQTEGSGQFPETGDIRFENVTFTYPETDEPALKNVSFTIPRGSSAAIVGLCGSGKTTSVSMLERFYTPESGRITIGETDIGAIALADFRRHLSYVQQEGGAFEGTLREVLTYGIERDVTDAEIFAAAEKTGFDEYLTLCNRELSAEVSATGMSGGQSQRMVLTRELLRGGDMILMDEPTSALDVRISAKLLDVMNTLFADKTRILITHDLRFAEQYDKILVLEDGMLVGEGTHESLLETCAAYREMRESVTEEAEA